ncbi:hypothetical protein DOTSEDRAFT_56337 [Dothistroma septosporum NZE10]|uniref:Ribosomal protein S2 n=1 Tax=Dothistroma septosporum (strain NZE10 / CBS 128990) TaxID=675120 RepID=N1PC73_DOTSN|nr:hypothetical protein DOTSEDRAFT_56337 [Dothistroma septosporum NZE10]
MIIRALRLRNGRLALPKPFSFRRTYASVEGTAGATPSSQPAFLQTQSTAQIQLDSIPNVRSVALNDPDHPVAQDYAFFQHQKARTAHLGTVLEPHYKPHELLTNPPSPKDITLELLLASQAHIGHATSLWNPANARYIFGVRGRKKDGESPIHIISLDSTAAHLRRACKIVSGVTEKGGLVLFVGTRQGQARAVVKAAEMAKGCHLFTKWIPGSITNGQQILGSCEKKVVNEFDQEVEGFESQLGTKAAVKPDLVVCLNPLENYVLLHECGLNNIPTIGIVDTDVNPTWVTYPIPANDDSLRCVQVIASVLGRAGQEGQAIRQSLAKRGIITHNAAHGLAAPENDRTDRRRERNDRNPRQRAAPAPTQDDEFKDLIGVEVKQHEDDQRLLQQAEEQFLRDTGVVSTELGPSTPAESSKDTSLLLGEDVDDTNSVAEELDESLIDEQYGSEYLDEDLAQFGGTDQLTDSPADDAANPAVLNSTTEIWPEQTGATSGETSPIDQVEDAAEELGEDEAPPAPQGNPDVEPADVGQGTEFDKGTAAEKSGAPEQASPVEVVTESEQK